MDLLATLRRSGGLDALARQRGLAPAVAAAGAQALLPALLGGMRDYAQAAGGGDVGIGAMLAVINSFGDGNLAVAVMGPDPLADDVGHGLLTQFFGSSDAGRRLAAEAGAVEGQDTGALERIVAPLAMLVSGYISARVEADTEPKPSLGWLRELLALDGHGLSSHSAGGN